MSETYEKTHAAVAAVREKRLAELVVKNAALVAALKSARDILKSYSTTSVGIHAAAIEQCDRALAECDAGYPELAP